MLSVAHSDTSSDQYVVSCLQACLRLVHLVHRPTGCSRDVPQPLCSPWGPHVCFRLSQCVHYFVNVVRVIAVRCGARGVAASALLRARSCSPARRVCGVLLLVAGGSWGLVLASKAQRISLWLCSSAPESNLKALVEIGPHPIPFPSNLIVSACSPLQTDQPEHVGRYCVFWHLVFSIRTCLRGPVTVRTGEIKFLVGLKPAAQLFSTRSRLCWPCMLHSACRLKRLRDRYQRQNSRLAPNSGATPMSHDMNAASKECRRGARSRSPSGKRRRLLGKSASAVSCGTSPTSTMRRRRSTSRLASAASAPSTGASVELRASELESVS